MTECIGDTEQDAKRIPDVFFDYCFLASAGEDSIVVAVRGRRAQLVVRKCGPS